MGTAIAFQLGIATAQLPFLEPIFFPKQYESGDLEKASATLGRLGLLVKDNRGPDRIKAEDGRKNGARIVLTNLIQNATYGAHESKDKAFQACNFLVEYYGTGKYETPYLPSYYPIYNIGRGLCNGWNVKTKGAGDIAHFLELYENAEPAVRPLIGYAAVYRLAGEWGESGWPRNKAKAWLEKSDAPPFFKSCIRAAILGGEANSLDFPDPERLNEISWNERGKELAGLFGDDSIPAKIRLMGATALISRSPAFINCAPIIQKIDQLLASDECSDLWPDTEPFHEISSESIGNAIDAAGVKASAKLIANRFELLRRFEKDHGRIYLDKDRLDQSLLTVGFLETPPDLGFVFDAIDAEDARGHAGVLSALICLGAFEKATELLPKPDQFIQRPLKAVLTKTYCDRFEAFRNGLEDQAMRYRLDGMVFRHFVTRESFQRPQLTLSDYANRIVENQELMGELSPTARAEMTVSTGFFSSMDNHLGELCARVGQESIAERLPAKDDSDYIWPYFFGTRMKARLLAGDWDNLKVDLVELRALGAKDRNTFSRVLNEFGASMTGSCTSYLLDPDGTWDLEGLLHFCYRTLALGCDYGYSDGIHRAPFQGFATMTALALGREFDAEKVKEHLQRGAGRKALTDFLGSSWGKNPTNRPITGFTYQSWDWRAPETRKAYQATFFAGFFRNDTWCAKFVQEGNDMTWFRRIHGLKNEQIEKAFEHPDIGPYAKFLIAKDGHIFYNRDEFKHRPPVFLEVIATLGEDPVHEQTVDQCRIMLAHSAMREGDQDKALKLLENAGQLGRNRLKQKVKEILAEEKSGSTPTP